MRGEVGREYVHARIYGHYGRLLKRNDYEMLAHRQIPGEGTAGFFFSDAAGKMVATREEIFINQASSLSRLMSKNRQYAKVLALFLNLYDVENLENTAAVTFGKDRQLFPWYDTAPARLFSREAFEQRMTGDKLHSIIVESDLGRYWRDTPPETFEDWERAFDVLRERLVRRSGEGISGRRGRARNEALTAFAALSLCMRRLALDFLEGGEEEENKEKETDWVRARRRWVSFFMKHFASRFPAGPPLQEERFFEAEKFFNESLWFWGRRHLFRNFHHIETVVAYLVLAIYQIRNFFALSEGLRLEMKPDDILGHIVCGE